MSDQEKISDKTSKTKYQEILLKERQIDATLKTLEEKSTSSYKMKLLHQYNDIKDATQVLIGAIANIEGVTVKELHQKFELPVDD